ncbi:MAG: GIY-YIG nuclease family protein, partial [Bryobacterales bacterium]|nr:GIY-YIG nuclease family protein [Bryobacterales bacterium]
PSRNPTGAQPHSVRGSAHFTRLRTSTFPRKIRRNFQAVESARLIAGRYWKSPGIYVLYRDDQPYYVGKPKRLYSRLHAHANRSTDKYFRFWDYFSAFVMPKPDHVDEIERILIASMTTANGAAPRIKEIRLPSDLGKILRKARLIQ